MYLTGDGELLIKFYRQIEGSCLPAAAGHFASCMLTAAACHMDKYAAKYSLHFSAVFPALVLASQFMPAYICSALGLFILA